MDVRVFKDIIGQEKAVVFLKQIAANERLGSAYLFTGIRGIGKTTTAMAFALLLNCADPVDGDGCRRCTSCRKIIDGNHPDLIVIEPDQAKKVISIDQVREINRHLAFSPAHGRYRVVIIDPAEKMTHEAANAFLKTLEEPPAHNIIILNVRDPRELLPTIVSRCQKVSFKPLPTGDIINWLKKENMADREKAMILARLSEGSLGKAVALAGDDLFAERVAWITSLQNAVDSPVEVLFDVAQKLANLGKKAVDAKELKDDKLALMLGIWKSWYRDMLLIKLGGTVDLVLNSDLANNLAGVVSAFTVDGLMRSLEVISRAERDLMNNKNVTYLLERSLFGLKMAAHHERHL